MSYSNQQNSGGRLPMIGSYEGIPSYYPRWPSLPMTWRGGAPNYGRAPYTPRQRVVLGPLEGLGQPPYYPRVQQLPMTWRGDVNYAIAQRQRRSSVVSGLGGVLAVL